MANSPTKRKRRKKKNNKHGIKTKTKSIKKTLSKTTALQFLQNYDQTKNDQKAFLTQEKLKMMQNPLRNKKVDELKPLLTWTFYQISKAWPSLNVTDVYSTVGTIYGMSAKFVQRNLAQWENFSKFEESKEGRYNKIRSCPMDDGEFRYILY